MARKETGLSGLAGRYALALFELADEKKSLDEVAGDLRGLKALIADSADLRRLIRSPLFSREEQAAAMGAVLERAGVCDLTRRFVLVVANNRRLFAVPQMIDAYLAELARRRGEVSAQVTSAAELTDEQHKALVRTLRATVGAKVQVDVKIDPSLIGGLIVKVGSRMIDDSVRGKLQRLRLAMKGIG
ncbi:MAG: F0F1 ATP synthase subunit delta [Kiloniellaceae bacterium]